MLLLSLTRVGTNRSPTDANVRQLEPQETTDETTPVPQETPTKDTPAAKALAHAPNQLIGVITSKPRVPILVDARNIVGLSNLAELFLTTARPATLITTTLTVIEQVKPWKLLPEAEKNRNWIRVLLVLTLFPWNWFFWRRQAATLVKEHGNHELVDLLQRREGKAVVFSNNLTPVIKPLIESLGFSNHVTARLISWRGQQHLQSTELVTGSPFSKLVANSIVVTDSENEPLLDSCQTPLVTNPDNTETASIPRAYVPLRYIHLTKKPSRKFIEYAWFKDDLYAVLLACSITAPLFPLHMVGVLLASLALWTTYEAGYHENDVLGDAREAEPVLPANFDDVKGTVPTVLPWVWATGLTTIASLFLAFGLGTSLTTAPILTVMWMLVLLVIRVVFTVFNRLEKTMRVIPHLILQVGKYVGFAAVSSLSLVGLGLLSAQVIYRWAPYAVYRWHPTKTFIQEPLTRTRLAVFWLIAIPALAMDPTTSLGIQFVLGSLFLGRRAVSTHLRMRSSQTTALKQKTKPTDAIATFGSQATAGTQN